MSKGIRRSSEDEIPPLTVDLVRQLNRRFPHQVPPVNITERELWKFYGIRGLVDSLMRELDITE